MIRAALALSAVALFAVLVGAQPTPVLLTEIQALTLRRGALTTARRGAPVPQLTCRGPHCAAHEPDVVQCTNQGTDGVTVQWACKADMPGSLRFSNMEVSCEGYARPGDAYVLAGSCGLTYELVGSAPSPPRHEQPPPPQYTYQPYQSVRTYPPSTSPSNVDIIMVFITIGVFVVIIVLIAAACAHAGRHDPSSSTTHIVVEPSAPAYGPAPPPAYVAAPAAPSVVYVDGLRHRRDSDRFVEGMWVGSALSGGSHRSAPRTEHHYHSAPAAVVSAPPPRSPSPPRTVTKEGYASTTVR